jgi:hypothetical protein
MASAHHAALQATSDSDPSLGVMIFTAILFILSLCISIALLGVALFPIAVRLLGHGR